MVGNVSFYLSTITKNRNTTSMLFIPSLTKSVLISTMIFLNLISFYLESLQLLCRKMRIRCTIIRVFLSKEGNQLFIHIAREVSVQLQISCQISELVPNWSVSSIWCTIATYKVPQECLEIVHLFQIRLVKSLNSDVWQWEKQKMGNGCFGLKKPQTVQKMQEVTVTPVEKKEIRNGFGRIYAGKLIYSEDSLVFLIMRKLIHPFLSFDNVIFV